MKARSISRIILASCCLLAPPQSVFPQGLRRCWCWGFGLMGALTISTFSGDRTLAQSNIVADDTLGAERSLVIQNFNGLPIELITGGATRGQNLFHSFVEFNVSEGRGAYFSSPADIQNILARVTGSNRSEILGTLGTLGNSTPNLFLINPNGIIFGANASLDVGGSFVATTAHGIGFGNQGFFSTTEPDAPPLLSVNPSAFFFNQMNAGRIENRSIAPAGVDFVGDELFGLRVPNGRSLLLVGGDIAIDGGRVNALGGRVELAGVAGSETVGLNIDGNNLSLSVPETVARDDVSLKNSAVLYVAADNGGSITINAQNLNILGRSFLVAGIEPGLGTTESQVGDITLNAKGAIAVEGSNIFNLVGWKAVGNGGDIIIKANSLSLTNFSEMRNDTWGRGNAGNVLVQVTEAALLTQGSVIYNRVLPGAIGNGGDITITASSASFLEGAELVANNTRAEGNVGNITVQARDHISFDGVDSDGFASGIFNVVRPDGRGNAGNIRLTAGSLSLTNGGRLQSNTRGQGDAGNIIIDVRDHFLLDGIDSLLRNETSSGVYTTVGTDGVGKGGDIYVTAGSLTATNGGQLTASTFEQGDAGNITIHVRDRASFDGVNINASGVFSAVAPGSVGQGGDISLTAGSLFLSNGALISAVTGGTGDAGRVTIVTRERVSVDGMGSDGSRSAITTAVLKPEAIGNANDIDITTELFSVTNGAQLTASTVGEGKAGNIRVMANTLQITNGGQLRTTTAGKGNAGNIHLVIQERVNLSGANSGLLANTEINSTGNGGSIFISNPASMMIRDGARVAVDSEGTGVGGNIEIQAGSVTLENEARLLAETASNTGGNITFQLQDILLLRNESKISTNAGTAQAGGDGGNITFKADFIIAVPVENSDITANAFNGRGGNINITTQGIYGLEFREELTPLSDITASSQFGVDGELQLDLLTNVDPTQGLATLPTNVIDPSQEIAQSCTPRGEQASRFVATGRGGLPLSPDEPLRGRAVVPSGWVTLDEKAETSANGRLVREDDQRDAVSSSPTEIVEADGWIVDTKGNVVLVAHSQIPNPVISSIAPASCPN